MAVLVSLTLPESMAFMFASRVGIRYLGMNHFRNPTEQQRDGPAKVGLFRVWTLGMNI
jgi:hypothetical protein